MTFNVGLGDLARLTGGKTRSICAENPDGRVGGGAQAVPDENNAGSALGKGWKIRPCISLQPFETTTLAEIEGPGMIRHIWITVDPKAYRSCILRMYWDGEETPSVEVPLGDFFANGHSLRCNINSLPVAVNPSGGFNCYWPMPFRKSAKITISNDFKDVIDGFFYQVDYELDAVPEDVGYFHAQWRRATTTREYPEHIILDKLEGKGHYVGTYLAWTQLSNGWWGEGEIKFYIDGDKDGAPTICGTGTEDYVGGAWCFGDTYSTAFLGYPLWRKEPGEVPRHGMYRWHVMDPIRFDKDLRVTIQALGWWPGGKFQPLGDDIASVAYWYQGEPHAAFPAVPTMEERFTR